MRTLVRIAVAVAVGLTVGFVIGSAAAVAAPPTSPPGRSGEAPGHEDGDPHPGDPSPAGHERKQEADAPAAPAAPTASAPALAPAAAPTETSPNGASAPSPRFENAAGKPKQNVPAAAEAAPESSISAPGNSGRHKLTICHKGHAITVDVHAARAHVDGHGDTYAAAGARGRAACPQTSGPTPPAPPPADPPGDPERPAAPADKAPASEEDQRPAEVAPARESVAEAAAAVPAGLHHPAGGAAAVAHSRTPRAGIASLAVASGSLPFTGAPLWTLALFGFGLLALGSLLLAVTRQPVRARQR